MKVIAVTVEKKRKKKRRDPSVDMPLTLSAAETGYPNICFTILVALEASSVGFV